MIMSRLTREFGRMGRRLVGDCREFNSFLAADIALESTDFVTKFSSLNIIDGAPSFVISETLKRVVSSSLPDQDKAVLTLLLTPMIKLPSEGNSPTRHGCMSAKELDNPEAQGEPVVFDDDIIDKVKERAFSVLPPILEKPISFVAELAQESINPMMSDGKRFSPGVKKVKAKRPLSRASQNLVPAPKQHNSSITPPADVGFSYEIANLRVAATGLDWPALEMSTNFKDAQYDATYDVGEENIARRFNMWGTHGDECEACRRFAKHVKPPLVRAEDWSMRAGLRRTLALTHCYSFSIQDLPFDDWIDTIDADAEIAACDFRW